MTKTELLFIRASKSLDPYKRVRSVYHRFYGRYDEQTTTLSLVNILSGIVEKYNPPSIISVMDALSPQNRVYYGCPDVSHYDVCLQFFINRLRYTDLVDLPGYNYPVSFRR